LKLEYDGPLSKIAFKFNLRRYNEELLRRVGGGARSVEIWAMAAADVRRVAGMTRVSRDQFADAMLALQNDDDALQQVLS
jgi:hypothetical protein